MNSSRDERTNDASASDRSAWDERYEENGDQMWSGQPNGSVVAEAATLTPGRALDIGCGEGADAVWLATRGWDVTATDISTTAIRRASEASTPLKLKLTFEASDVATSPPAQDHYDLVALSYPALRKDRCLSAVSSIASAVAVGGRLLVVGHVHDHSQHADSESDDQPHGFDPNDYVSIDDIIAILADGFAIELDDERDRPDPPTNTHHQRDRVLLARRL